MSAINSRTVITLTTDFGADSPYVAQLKGVLLSRNPELQLVDITHSIPPQDVRAGAVVLDDVCRRFPPHTIHLAVIDPGVGTSREIVLAKIGQHRFIAPNNGLLTLVSRRQSPERLISITNRLYFLPHVSATFHGRDIMAPVAAHLSLGLHPEHLGPPLAVLQTLPFSEPRQEPARIVGSVLQVDSFGNLITNIYREHLVDALRASEVRVLCGNHSMLGLHDTYGRRPGGELMALIGSSGRLELAMVQGSAAQQLGVDRDEPVIVEWQES